MSSKEGTACLGIIAVVVLALVGSVLVNAWALMTLWNWFMPYFFELPVLTAPSAFAISLVLSTFMDTSENKKDEDTKADTIFEAILYLIARITIRPLFLVFMGWILKGFVF